MSVLGNHDYTYYMDVDDEQEIAALEKRMQDFQRSCGWRLLMNEHVAVHRGADSIYVAGTENYDNPKRTNVRKALYGIRPGSFVLMLQHIPKQWRETWPSTINKEKDEDGDVIGPDRKDSLVVAPQLTLSGHTHAGRSVSWACVRRCLLLMITASSRRRVASSIPHRVWAVPFQSA